MEVDVETLCEDHSSASSTTSEANYNLRPLSMVVDYGENSEDPTSDETREEASTTSLPPESIQEKLEMPRVSDYVLLMGIPDVVLLRGRSLTFISAEEKMAQVISRTDVRSTHAG